MIRGFSRAVGLAAAVLILWAAQPARAQHEEPAGALEVQVRVRVADRTALEELTGLVSIESVRDGLVEASATPDELRALAAHGYTWTQGPPRTDADQLTMCPAGWVEDDDRSWSCYPTYDQYTSLMDGFAARFPDRCRLVDLGATANEVRPHRLLALVITDNPEVEEDEPEVFLTSTMHGDEPAGFVLMLRLIATLLEDWGTDSAITDLVNTTEIWVNPLANPDGTYFAGDDTVAGAIRRYATREGSNSGVDPNRNFPSTTGDDHPDGHPWWPETRAMMAIAETQSFALSANLHSGFEVVNYPWDTWQRRHPDDSWLRDLARDWADLAQADSPGGYLTSRDNGITNGWDWYQVSGGRQDWITYFHGGREVTVELSHTKMLPADRLEDLWHWNRRALLDFMDHAHAGIRGIVSDQRGRPVAATVTVLEVDRAEDGSSVRTDPDVGDYHRLLLPGLYDLEFHADGCLPSRFYGIAVSDGQASRLDVALWCGALPRASRRLAP
jgi:predicted deacylase